MTLRNVLTQIIRLFAKQRLQVICKFIGINKLFLLWLLAKYNTVLFTTNCNHSQIGKYVSSASLYNCLMGSRCLVRRSGGFKIIGSFRFKNKSFHYKANTTIFCIAFKDLKCGNSYTSVLNSSKASLEISCCKNFQIMTSCTEEEIAMIQQKQ